MNHQQATPYQQFFQHHHDVTTGTNFHHGSQMAAAANSANLVGAQANMANAFMLGQAAAAAANAEDLYHHNHQTQHMSLAYQQAAAAAAASNHLLRSHPQVQQRYVLPSTATAAGMTNPYFSAATQFTTGAYSMVDPLSSIKYHQQQNPGAWHGQSPATASLFPSIFASQQQPSVADAYFNVVASQSPPGTVVGTANSPLAGLRALSEQYSYAGARRTPKSPSKTSTGSANQPPTPNMASAIASPPTAIAGPGTNSPQQTNSFIPPSPILKSSSQTTHSSPLSASTTHSSHGGGGGGGSFLVGSPATPRGRSVSSTGSVEAHSDSTKTATAGGPYVVDGAMIQGNPFSVPVAPSMQQAAQVFEETLTHPSGMGSFYAQGMDPSAALIDPSSATLFGAQVVGSDPSLHSAMDDALSMLGRDVNLADIDCANMMVGQNFWDDLGDAVLDDPLLGPSAAAGCSSSVDLVNSNNISATGPGGGVLLHSVLEFGALGSGSSGCGNGHASAEEVAPFRYQEDVAMKCGSRSSISNDLIGVPNPTPAAAPVSVIQQTPGDVTVATPKLREKMKRKAQGENELAEIDRAFARHLSMVVEKNKAQLVEKVDETPLEELTADSCLTSRLRGRSTSKSSAADATSPVLFEQTSTSSFDAELDELKRNVRKMMYAKRQQEKAAAKLEQEAKRKSISAKASSLDDARDSSTPAAAAASVAAKTARKSEKVPIYKQKSISVDKTAPERRRSSTVFASVDADSPYSFTEDDDEKEKGDPMKDAAETSVSMDQAPTVGPVDEMKQKMLDEEVAKKLQQISSLHPELRLSTSGEKERSANDNFLRHIVPKKRQNWNVGGGESAKNQSQETWPAEAKIGLKRKSTTSASVFVKTEILTDDYSTAMPSTIRPAKVGQTTSSTENKGETEESGGVDRTLLPKLIIRIPKKCLEQAAPASSMNGLMNDNGEDQDSERHHHRKKRKEKRKRHESELDDEGSATDELGKKRRHKRHKSKSGMDDGADGAGQFLDDGSAGTKSHRKSTSENDTSDQDVKGFHVAKACGMLNQEKKDLGSNGLEWDRLPFKLRKKLHIPSTTASESPGTFTSGKAPECGGFNTPTASTNEAYSHGQSEMEEQHRDLINDSIALTALRSRFPSGPVFQKGAFVVCKDDIGKPDCPLWKVDSQNLLQKFSPTDRQGKIAYVSTSTFAGWCLQNQDLYAPVQVRYVIQSRSESIVELESSLEEIFPAVSTEITDEHPRNGANGVANPAVQSSSEADTAYALMEHPQADALVAYVHVLLLHALLGNVLQSLRNSHNNGDRLARMKDVDLMNSEKCAKSTACINWQPAFKESVEWYPHCTVSEDEGFGLQCQACGNAVVCNVLQLFANEGYDFDTLEPRPPRTTGSGSPLPSQDYHLCSSCATVAVRYHKLFHMRYHLFRKCEDAVELIRDGNPTLAAGAVADACIKNKKWLSNTLNEYLQLWSTIS